MKRIHIYILTAMVLLNSSCSADWLDLNTTSSVETGQAIVTLDDAQIALNGIYRLASGHSYYGDNYWYYGDCRAADVQAEVTDVTATTVTFTAPDVSGEQNILLKQDGGEWILGVLHFPEVPNTPGGDEEEPAILPTRISHVRVRGRRI